MANATRGRFRYWLPFVALSALIHAGVLAVVPRSHEESPQPIVVKIDINPVLGIQPKSIAKTIEPASRPRSSPHPLIARHVAEPAPIKQVPQLPRISMMPHFHRFLPESISTTVNVPSLAPTIPPIVREAPAPLLPIQTAQPTTEPTTFASPESSQADGDPQGWANAIGARLERNKRYPDSARARGVQGVVYVTVTVDRAGTVIASSVARSSGSSILDAEALELVRRSEPLPAPPSNVRPGQIDVDVTIPIAFRM